MPYYEIKSTTGVASEPLKAATAQVALDEYCQDAGYQSHAHMLAMLDCAPLTAKEVPAPPGVRAPITPWNPSRRAVARVKAPLPAPTTCPYCGAGVELVSNAKIYGMEYGTWPWAYLCQNTSCRASVGLHPFTAIPLGTLADRATSNARKIAKAWFAPLYLQGVMSRSEAYAWLAGQLGIENVEHCHIAWFDSFMCGMVVDACASYQRYHPGALVFPEKEKPSC